MKVEEFAYQVAARTMDMLEHEQHYKIPEETRKKVFERILASVNEIIRKAS